jgi:hypothetical protein
MLAGMGDRLGCLANTGRNELRKLIVIASLAVLAVAIVTPFANAAVSYDNARVGNVDRGDVQALFGWNDAEMQANAAAVTFTTSRLRH